MMNMDSKEKLALRKTADEIWEMSKRLRADGFFTASDEVKNISSLLHAFAAGHIKLIEGK